MNKSMMKVLISMAALVFVSLACALPNVSSLLNPLPQDDFSDSNSGWGTGTDSQSSVEYQDGGLKMIVFQPLYLTWSTAGLSPYENIHMEVSVNNQSSDPKAFFGLVCNAQGGTTSFYYVGVSSDGYYAFIKSAVAADDVYLKESSSDVISSSGSSMRLGLDCSGSSLTLYVNGQRVDSASDSTYTSGAVGLFTASDAQASGATVTFDDFAVTKLGQ